MAKVAGLLLALIVITGCAHARDSIIVSGTDIRRGSLGTCGDVAMPEVLFGSNEYIAVGDRTYRIDGETLRIETDDLMTPIGVGWRLFPDEDIDIELSFATVEGELLVYWRETFRHRGYRHGFLRVVGDGIEEVCRGSGGYNRGPDYVH